MDAADRPGELAISLCLADRRRLRLSERAPALAAVALGRRRGGDVLGRFPHGRACSIRSPSTATTRRCRTRSRTTRSRDWLEDTGFSWIWVAVLARDPRQPLRRRARNRATASSLDRDRATADDVARLGGGVDSSRAAHVRSSPSFVFGDSVIDWVLFPFLLADAGCGRGVGRDRRCALPPVRDRTDRQSHGRLRGAHVPALGRVCGDHGWVRRRRRQRLRMGDRS